MDQAKVNDRFAITFVDQLAASGVEHVCLAPGSRSAALAIAFARHPRLRTWVLIDERCCSFFALGIAKATGRPVALLCTSGTAAAEFHAAVVEADMSRTPLVVLTADRPSELVGVGANQAIDQTRIYGGAVRWCADPGPPSDEPHAARAWRRLAVRAVTEALSTPPGPVHLNLRFREPLVPAPGELSEPVLAPAASISVFPATPDLRPLMKAVRSARRPVIVAGEIRSGTGAWSAAAAKRIPLLAEPSSHLRVSNLPYDAILHAQQWPGAHVPDLIVRLGATPTSKPLNQWLSAADARTILVDPAGWRDPDLLATDILRVDPVAAMEALGRVEAPREWRTEWDAAGKAALNALDDALRAAPLFEAHVVRALARALPESGWLFIGSSMAIRDADTFWPAARAGQHFLGNRGASGIDGLVSTGLGMAVAAAGHRAVLLLGDLSLYHDMNGLWAAGRHGLRTTVVVLDNGGGGIFSFLPEAAHEGVFEEVFGTPLGLRLEDVARLYDLGFYPVDEVGELDAALGRALATERSTMVAVRFARPDSVAGHRACWQAVGASLGD